MDDSGNKQDEAMGQDAPGWQEVWKKNLSQIDDKLVELYKDAGEAAGDVTERIKESVQHMLDKTDMDEKARANWEKAKADSKLLGAQIENRVAHLIADGKISWAKLTKKQDR